MLWFQRDHRYYVGPMSDEQLNRLQQETEIKEHGVACMADRGKVEVYFTLPAKPENRKLLERIRLGLYS